MAEDKPCISELYKSGGLDMELVGKIAHNELDKQKGFPFSSVSASSIRALASDYIDSYANDVGIIEAFAVELDSQLSTEDYRGGEISPEFMLGCAISLGAASHANADIDYFSQEFNSRAVIEIEELGLPALRDECRSADDFSLAGINPDTKFPLRMQNSASSGMSSPTASRSMQSSKWRKSTSNRVSRVLTISTI